MSPSTRTRAQTVGELDLHLEYVAQDLAEIKRALPNMATKDDLRALEQRMTAFATKEEVRALEQKLQAETVSSTFERWTSFITKAGTAATVVAGLCAAIAALVHFLDRVPK